MGVRDDRCADVDVPRRGVSVDVDWTETPEYRARVEWERETFTQIESAITRALTLAAEMWDADYAFTYVQGRLDRLRPPKPPRTGYHKQPIPAALRWEVFKRDDFRCLHCGSRDNLRADHVVPERSGGEMALDNLQTLCRSCNSKKGWR